MAWVRIEDGFPDHPKVLGLPDAAFRLHIHAMCYAARLLTDGVIAKTWLTGGKGRMVPKAVAQLVDAGLWEAAGNGDYRIHDYLKYQPSRADVEQSRADAADRMKRARNVRANKSRTSAELPENFARSSQRDVTTTHPLPSHPIAPTAFAARAEMGASPTRKRNFGAVYEHARFDVPEVWHRKRVDGLRDGELGMDAFYKHLGGYVDAHPDEDTEPRFEWLTKHFDAWVKARQKPATSSDVPDVEETRRRYLSTR
jgi:hypothetical protein